MIKRINCSGAKIHWGLKHSWHKTLLTSALSVRTARMDFFFIQIDKERHAQTNVCQCEWDNASGEQVMMQGWGIKRKKCTNVLHVSIQDSGGWKRWSKVKSGSGLCILVCCGREMTFPPLCNHEACTLPCCMLPTHKGNVTAGATFSFFFLLIPLLCTNICFCPCLRLFFSISTALAHPVPCHSSLFFCLEVDWLSCNSNGASLSSHWTSTAGTPMKLVSLCVSFHSHKWKCQKKCAGWNLKPAFQSAIPKPAGLHPVPAPVSASLLSALTLLSASPPLAPETLPSSAPEKLPAQPLSTV